MQVRSYFDNIFLNFLIHFPPTQGNVNFEREKLRIKLGHMKGVCKLVQDESTSASQEVSLVAVFFNTNYPFISKFTSSYMSSSYVR